MAKKIKIEDFRGFTLNDYRNWHYYKSNKIKKEFEKMVSALRIGKLNAPVEIEYVIRRKDNRRFDLDNIVVVAKFFHDGLVSSGALEDDDKNTIKAISFRYDDSVKEDAIIIEIKESNDGKMDSESGKEARGVH